MKSKKQEKIRFSGFIGILPEIKQGNNGFSYFRRGRVVEGSGDEKVFPKKISSNPSSFRYKRLFTYDCRKFTLIHVECLN